MHVPNKCVCIFCVRVHFYFLWSTDRRAFGVLHRTGIPLILYGFYCYDDFSFQFHCTPLFRRTFNRRHWQFTWKRTIYLKHIWVRCGAVRVEVYVIWLCSLCLLCFMPCIIWLYFDFVLQFKLQLEYEFGTSICQLTDYYYNLNWFSALDGQCQSSYCFDRILCLVAAKRSK